MTSKLSLVGRPGKVVKKGTVVVTALHNAQAPTLPKGLPPLPEPPTTYIACINLKQWRKLERFLEENAEDKLIVEGFPRLTADGNGVYLICTMASTIMMQRIKREEREKYLEAKAAKAAKALAAGEAVEETEEAEEAE